MLVTVLVVPVVLIAMLLVVQFAFAYHARQVLSGAAQDGAASGARQESSPAAGSALADALIEGSAGAVLTSHSTSAGSDGRRVTVAARGNVVRLLPFFPTITVKASASATLERFDAAGAP